MAASGNRRNRRSIKLLLFFTFAVQATFCSSAVLEPQQAYDGSIYEEYLDNHMDNRHSDLLDLSANRCVADVCGAIQCDHVANEGKAAAKKRCSRAPVIKNKHLCGVLWTWPTQT
ncbi:hypothetical protein R1flu_009818 [Riccia fluitans]|uniref:Uncharacterized protein n=1 Tax=Riccia fluitans TaxID=41844 RepID=A0ABD1Z384_9MARC